MTYCVLVSFSVEGPSPKLFCDFALLRNFTGTVTTAWICRAKSYVRIRRGSGCYHRGPFFTGSSKKSIRTFVDKRQACTVIRFVAMRMSLCSHGLHLLILSKHPGYTREKERKKATHQKVFADLTSSYIRREVVQIKLQLFIIPQAADHQKAFTFNLWHYHSVFTCDVRREILFPYCMHQNSTALLCNSLLFIVVGQSTEVQMKTHGPELLRKSLQPFKSTPQFSKWRLSAKAGPVNVFTGNVPMQLRELT